jgi:hypothetical protein
MSEADDVHWKMTEDAHDGASDVRAPCALCGVEILLHALDRRCVELPEQDRSEMISDGRPVSVNIGVCPACVAKEARADLTRGADAYKKYAR